MAQIDVYVTPSCPYCVRAKALLQRKGAAYREIDVAKDDAAREDLVKRTGRRTVPQIFINGQHIGGCDDLYALDGAGGLDPLLAE